MRTTRNYGRLLRACLALSVASCAVVTSRDEYGAFRALRYERDPDRRLQLASAFQRNYPNSSFRSVISSELGTREQQFWDEHRATMEGLEAYLHSYPSGSHAGEARARMEAINAERDAARREREEREAAERRRLEEERRAANERQRYFARTTFLYWLRQLGQLQGWGGTLREFGSANAQFSEAFGGAPQPQCRGRRCRKTYDVNFGVPVPGRTALQRQLSFSFDLIRRDAQHVDQSALLMQRRGLSSWYECESQSACDPNDAEQRANSVRWAMDQLRGIVAVAFPDARETPQSLVGPEPEMVGAEEEEAAQQAAPPPPIPPQPLGTQFSFVVGCGNVGGAVISIPESARATEWSQAAGEAQPARSCLRIDGYSAPDIQGVSTDEGLQISFLPASSLPRGGRAAGGGGRRRGR